MYADMAFENSKKLFLSKKDKSNIGRIDAPIRELVDIINTKPCYFTTSSCSGRIMLLRHPPDGRKDRFEKLFVSHESVDAGAMIDLLRTKETSSGLPEEEAWFRMEGLILHVCCRTIVDAEKLLDIARSSGIGLKRTGITSLGGKIIVEILGTEILDCPISKNKKLLVDDHYLELLIESANKKLEKNRKKIEEIKKLISSL